MSDPPNWSPLRSDDVRKGGSPSVLSTLAGAVEVVLILLVLASLRLLVMRFTGG